MKQDYEWYNAQLHNHTCHSDGRASVAKTIDLLRERGAQVLALTDHNAASGNEEFLKCCAERGVIGIRGNEISTYFGHVVGLGLEEYVDWRYMRPDDPESIFDLIHERGGLCGYAHPIRIGYPLVPGCSWLFRIHDYSRIDYYEILNTGDYLRSRNDMVIEEWIGKLREGLLHLGAVSALDYHGRPWHGHEYVTWLALPHRMENPEKSAMEAIRRQNMIVCKDRLIELNLVGSDGKEYIPGERVPDGPVRLRVRAEGDALPARPVYHADDADSRREIRPDVPFEAKGFAVVRLFDGQADFDHLVAITNPFHFGGRREQ
ncbi:MAG: CehA/McbA family metallohydrolase [Clostridia bacterium]|nr:CehA/McbA family metallohydrolase [Clostridia bacterium]